jgi:hypothetical protein
MTIVALERIALINALGDMGDRQQQGLSTVIRGNEWHIEANYHNGALGDAIVYQNKNANVKGAEPNWKWYAAIPAANIKAYQLAGDAPSPSAVTTNGQPQATNTTSRAQGSNASAKS